MESEQGAGPAVLCFHTGEGMAQGWLLLCKAWAVSVLCPAWSWF